MSVHLRSLHWSALDELRHEPIQKRIRATIGDETVVDTTRALLVYEPKRVVPSYAIPDQDIAGEIRSGAVADNTLCDDDLDLIAGRPILDPRVPFAVHTADGELVSSARPEPAARRRASGSPTPSSRVTSSSRSRTSTPGTRRTSATSATRATRSTASTSSTARATCAWSTTGRRGGVLAAGRGVRAAAAGPLLPAGRGRADRPLHAERHPHAVRVQGRGVVLVAARRRGRRLVLIWRSGCQVGVGDRGRGAAVVDGWSVGRDAGLGVGVASLMMRGLGTPGPWFRLPACAV